MTLARFALIVVLALTAGSDRVRAQIIGPGGVPIAPGPSTPPNYTPGGVGPGGVQIAPGPAARGIVEQQGVGGTRYAPGAAGTLSEQRAPTRRVTRTFVNEPRVVSKHHRHVKKAKRVRHHHGRHHAKRRTIRVMQ